MAVVVVVVAAVTISTTNDNHNNDDDDDYTNDNNWILRIENKKIEIWVTRQTICWAFKHFRLQAAGIQQRIKTPFVYEERKKRKEGGNWGRGGEPPLKSFRLVYLSIHPSIHSYLFSFFPDIYIFNSIMSRPGVKFKARSGPLPFPPSPKKSYSHSNNHHHHRTSFHSVMTFNLSQPQQTCLPPDFFLFCWQNCRRIVVVVVSSKNPSLRL